MYKFSANKRLKIQNQLCIFKQKMLKEIKQMTYKSKEINPELRFAEQGTTEKHQNISRMLPHVTRATIYIQHSIHCNQTSGRSRERDGWLKAAATIGSKVICHLCIK